MTHIHILYSLTWFSLKNENTKDIWNILNFLRTVTGKIASLPNSCHQYIQTGRLASWRRSNKYRHTNWHNFFSDGFLMHCRYDTTEGNQKFIDAKWLKFIKDLNASHWLPNLSKQRQPVLRYSRLYRAFVKLLIHCEFDNQCAMVLTRVDKNLGGSV